MPYLQLDLSAVRSYDEGALGALYRDIAVLRRKKLVQDEVRSIYRSGITIMLTGHGLGPEAELNYALFYSRIKPSLPATLTVSCIAGSGQSHAEVIQQGDPDRLIVAGTLNNGSFSGVSTTWLKQAQPGSGKHALGLYMNDLLLKVYNIKGDPVPEQRYARVFSRN
jgi:hypothetical protein